MTAENLRQRLEDLLQLIRRERDQAKALDMEGLEQSAVEKQRMLQSLDGDLSDQEDPEVQRLAQQVRDENRRNAYLFWLTLGWVREQMTFFGQKTAPASYGAGASQISHQRGGRLLSGRI